MKVVSYPRLLANAVLILGICIHVYVAATVFLTTHWSWQEVLGFVTVWTWILLPYAVAAVLIWKGYFKAAIGWLALTTIFDVLQVHRLATSPKGGPDFTALIMPLLNLVLIGPLGAALSSVLFRTGARFVTPSNNRLERQRHE